jgi:hypothetical protein
MKALVMNALQIVNPRHLRGRVDGRSAAASTRRHRRWGGSQAPPSGGGVDRAGVQAQQGFLTVIVDWAAAQLQENAPKLGGLGGPLDCRDPPKESVD